MLSNQENCLSKQLPHFLEINSENELQTYPRRAKFCDTLHLLLSGAFANPFVSRVIIGRTEVRGQNGISDEKLLFRTGSHKNEFSPKMLKIATQHYFL